MDTLSHIKLAAFTGLVTGTLHGIIDIISKAVVWSFEWFELYQTLLLSIIAFTLGFAIIGILFEVFTKISKLKISNKAYYNFYLSTSLALLLLFYSATIVNRDILPKMTFWSPKSLSINLFVFLAIGSIYILFLTKGKNLTLEIVSFFNKSKFNKIVKNFLFAIWVFVIISLALDIYLLNYFPSSGINPKLEQYPNIVLISLDAVRADHLSFYGYPLNTSPNLDALAIDSVVFENAISSSVWTILTHGSMFTGKYVSNFDPEHTNKGLKQKEYTLAEMSKAQGYNTAGFISGAWIKAKFGFGQGFETYKDRMAFFEQGLAYDKFSIKGALLTFFPAIKSIPNIKSIFDVDERLRSIYTVNEEALEWLDKNSKSRFFMFVHYIGPHVPYDPSDEFRKKFADDARDYYELEKEFLRSSGKKRYENVSVDIVDALTDLYDAKLAETDFVVGKLIRKLDELGIKNNTIIIVTADHGEELYDHGYFKHGTALYQESVHIPLIMYYPKEFQPRWIEETVSTIDIFPTILDILNIKIPEYIDGVSLLPLIKNDRPYQREFVKSELFGLPGHETKKQIAIIDNEWKLIEVEPNVETIPSGLYNLRTDPMEKKNLYDVFIEKRKQLQKYIEDSN